MQETEFDLDLDELVSAEDFLDYFDIEYDPSIVHVNRLHILQRFHDYLAGVEQMPEQEHELKKLYGGLLNSAYSDFVHSDAITEKVFRVFRMHEPMSVEVPLMEITRQVGGSAS